MSKKSATLIISLGCAAILSTAAYFAINSSKSNAADSEPKLIASTIDGEIDTIKYENKEGAAEELTLLGDSWHLSKNEAFPLNQSSAEAMASACKNVSATRYVGESADKSEYGLAEPLLTVTVGSNGNDTTYLIGSKNSHTGDYYFNVSGTDGIYTVGYSFVSAFESTAEEMAVIEQPPTFTPAEADSVKIIYNGEESVLSGKTLPKSDESASEAETREYTLQKNGEETKPDADKAESLLRSISGLSLTGCAAFMPESLADYGLSEPYAEITVQYTKAPIEDEAAEAQKSYTLLIGSATPDKRRYIMLNGTNMVSAADEASIENILSKLE